MDKQEENKNTALFQLRKAVELLKQHNYVWAATFGRKADEILSRAAKKNAGVDAVAKYLETLDRAAALLAEKRKKNHHISQIIDRIRSELKRPWDEEPPALSEKAKNDAAAVIDCAILNYQIAYGDYPEDPVIKSHISHPYAKTGQAMKKKSPGR